MPELRARGVQVNLAAWYPWQKDGDTSVKMDSVAIFLIGPCAAVRRVFDPSVLGIAAPELPLAWANTQQILRNDKGAEISRAPTEVNRLTRAGQGYPLETYTPKGASERKNTLIRWTFSAARERSDSVVTENVSASENNKGMFPTTPDGAIGNLPWTWPLLPPAKQEAGGASHV